MCKDVLRKTKVQLTLKSARNVKNYKKGFFGYVKNKQKLKEKLAFC